MFALVDCNNFYASCERLFQPKLQNQPIVVLSNNDGCIIARSNEAKALGIKMGEPYFKAKYLIESNNVAVFSANFSLYGDLSERVMNCLEYFCPDIEIYSIDEAFLNLQSLDPYHLEAYAQEIRKTVFRWTGIPVSIGIAPTKTLAKLANNMAKKTKRTGVHIINEDNRERILESTDISDVWGIGRRIDMRLKAFGISRVSQLVAYPDKWLQSNFNVVLLRTVEELRGTPCYGLEVEDQQKQSITCSRSFKTKITDLKLIEEAISTFTAKAAEKLRHEKLYCGAISVFIRTSPFDENQKIYSNSNAQTLTVASNITSDLSQIAIKILRGIYKPHLAYQKAGITLLDFQEARPFQADLFTSHDPIKQDKLMKALDTINQDYGKGTLRYLSQGLGKRDWHMNREQLSPPYTRSWKHLPIVKA